MLFREIFMDKEVIEKLKNLKEKYEKDGFIILGVFGSFARGDDTGDSDIDLLYELNDDFYDRYPGFKIYTVIDRIEHELETEFQRRVDLANRNALNEIGKKYILPEVVYV